MSDVNAVVIVHFTKHWDNDTKGTMEFGVDTLVEALRQAKNYLYDEALEGAEDNSVISKKSEDLFTITKAEYGVPSNWIGV